MKDLIFSMIFIALLAILPAKLILVLFGGLIYLMF